MSSFRTESGDLGLPGDLGDLVERLPVGVFRSTPDGKILWANSAMAELFGLSDSLALTAVHAADLYAEPAERDEIRADMEAGALVNGREVRLRTLSGGPAWGRLTSRPIRDAGGVVLYYEGVIEDVTDRRTARSEWLQGATPDGDMAASHGLVAFDDDLRLVRVNEAFAQMLGMFVEDLVGRSLRDLGEPSQFDQADGRLSHLRAGKMSSYDVERLLQHATGRPVRVRFSVSAVSDPGGEPVGFRAHVTDITDRRPDALSTVTSEALMSSAFDTSPTGMVVTSRDMSVTRVNGSFCRMLGLSPDEAIELKTADVMHPDDYRTSIARMEDMAAGAVRSYSAERRLRHRDGHYLWVLLGVTALLDPTGELTAVLTQVVDISERRRIEEAMRDSEARFRAAFDEAPVGMAIGNSRLLPTAANRALCRMLGYTEQELLAMPPQQALGVEGAKDIARRFELQQAGQTGLFPTELELRCKDGSSLHALINVASMGTVGGVPTAVLAHFVDITALHRAQERLEASEAENRALLEGIPDLMFRIDRSGTIRGYQAGVALGPAMAPEVFLDRTIEDVLPAVSDAAGSAIESVLEVGGPEMFEYDMDIEGQRRAFECRITRLADDQVLALIRDITDRRRVDEQLQALVRSKDEFVAAVSHELRTPLTTVVGLASELRDRGEEFTEAESTEFVGLIADQSREMAELVEDLLAAAQADVGLLDVELMFVDLEREVRDVLAALREEDVHVRAGSPVVVLADPFRVRQVVRNLITNARRYGGATIEIEIDSEETTGSVRVCDDGRGIPEGEWELIFDPYYRAHHREGQPASLGLGLTIGRMLAWLMNGELDYSYDEGWSVFELTLPIPGAPPS